MTREEAQALLCEISAKNRSGVPHSPSPPAPIPAVREEAPRRGFERMWEEWGLRGDLKMANGVMLTSEGRVFVRCPRGCDVIWRWQGRVGSALEDGEVQATASFYEDGRLRNLRASIGIPDHATFRQGEHSAGGRCGSWHGWLTDGKLQEG